MIKNHLRTLTVIIALLTALICILSCFSKFSRNIKALIKDDSPGRHICKVNSYPIYDGDKIKFYGQILETDAKADIQDYNFYISVPADAYDIIEFGSTLSINCPITVADDAANHGNFNYRSYLMSRNAIGILYVDSSADIKPVRETQGIGTAIYSLRQKAIFNIHKYFNGDDRALITALLTGDRSDFNDSLFDKYKTAGIYHIVAVSGLHTSIFISLIAYLIAMLPLRNRRKSILTKTAAILISVLLFMFTGHGISIVRVIFMSSVLWVGMVLHREYNLISSVAAAAFMILVLMPYQILSSSFQLSFLSTLGMCVALELTKGFNRSPKKLHRAVTSLAISAGSTIATAPICAYSFGAISLLGLVFNLAAIPVSTALLVSVVVFSLLSAFLPETIMLMLRAIPLFLSRIINAIATLADSASALYISVNLQQTIIFLLIATALTVIIYFAIKKKYIKSLVTAVLIVAINLSLYAYTSNRTTPLKVTFINAVRGEATLLRTPDGRNIMFDCGSATFDSPGEDLFATYFMHNGVRKIDKLYISYFDDEHINGISKLMELGFVKQVVIPPEISAKDKIMTNRQRIINSAAKLGIPVVYMHKDACSDIENDLTVSFAYDNFDMSDKNGCAVYRIAYKDVSFVLSSCLGAKGQTALTGSTECDVIKVPNYGSKVKATEQYILSSKPKYAVITAPARDRYAKVDTDLLSALENKGIPTLRTDTHQTITFVTDGNDINKVITRKGKLP